MRAHEKWLAAKDAAHQACKKKMLTSCVKKLNCAFLHPRKWRTRAPVLTGCPGAAPGGVASKNGWVYMRIQGGFISLGYFCLCVCPLWHTEWQFRSAGYIRWISTFQKI